MNILALVNPNSGRGNGGRIADRFAKALTEDGHHVRLFDVSDPSRNETNTLNTADLNADVLLVCGGDGTLHHAADLAISNHVPLYHIPAGTENLFAREFGMNLTMTTLRRALASREIVCVDAATCNSRTFVLMCSMGVDAGVIHRLTMRRDKSITHLSYIWPMLAELFSPRFPSVSIQIDGRQVVREQRGLLVVGNSRQYGARFDPALQASMTDGLLDVVFMPCESRTRILRWAIACRLRRHLQSPELVYERGRSITVYCHDEAAPVQLDGEAAPPPDSHSYGAPRMLSMSVRPGLLPVLAVPADG